jgi:hypothetical protein
MSFKYAMGRRSLGALAAITAFAASLAGTSESRADIIQIASDSAASTSSLGSFTGSIDYAFSGALNSWAVSITLNNTSPAGNGGAITAFLFNIDSTDANADATLASSTNANFNNLTNGNGQPFGNNYDAGASLDNNFQGGGGNPNMGITPGQSSTFVFTVAAADAASLTAIDFINGPYAYDFIVRFRGFNGNGSDKVPALVTVIPGPSALCAIALGLVLVRKRRRIA